MALTNSKTDIVTELDATPPTYHGPKRVRGVVREDIATHQFAADDSDNSTARFVRVPSHARITQVLASGDGADTDVTVNVGVYKADGGAVVDEDFFASAWAGLNTAARNADITYESAVADVEDEIKPLWEQLGESEDPKIDYDITATLAAAMDAASDMTLKVRYVIDA